MDHRNAKWKKSQAVRPPTKTVSDIMEVKRELVQPEISSWASPQETIKQNSHTGCSLTLEIWRIYALKIKILSRELDRNECIKPSSKRISLLYSFYWLAFFCLNYTWSQANNNCSFDHKSIRKTAPSLPSLNCQNPVTYWTPPTHTHTYMTTEGRTTSFSG